jgi:hypothetical protein
MATITDNQLHRTESVSLAQMFAVLMAVLAFFLPGVKFGSVPVPLLYCLSLVYIFLVNPGLPRRYLAIFGLGFIYLTTVSVINASHGEGDIRDVMYSLLFGGELTLFCAMRDMFDHDRGDDLVTAMTWCAAANLALMVLQTIDLFGMDEGLKALWRLPLNLFSRGDPADFANADVIRSRPYGLLPGFNLAGLSLYLVFRTAHVYTKRQSYRIWCLVAVLLATDRSLTVLFILYEIILPVFKAGKGRGRRLGFSLLALGALVAATAALWFANPDFFLRAFYEQVGAGAQTLGQNYSLTNRLESLQWAGSNLSRIFTIGGVPSEVFRNFSRAVDSEAILRSMQFGIWGFFLIILMVYGYFHKYRSYDTYFLLAIMLWTSLTSTAASNFVICPFLFLYGFACRARAKADSAVLAGRGDAVVA